MIPSTTTITITITMTTMALESTLPPLVLVLAVEVVVVLAEVVRGIRRGVSRTNRFVGVLGVFCIFLFLFNFF